MKWLWIPAVVLLLVGCSQTKQESAHKAPPPPEYFKVEPSTAASLHGVVHFAGKKPAAKLISMDAEEACQKLHSKPVKEEIVVTGKDGALTNAFVYIKSGLEGKKFEPVQTAVVLDQHGCTFVPRVIALRTGQTLSVKNSDPVSHNIHPMPQNNREWNQQQSPGAADLQRKFGFPEVMIPVKCNVHNWMHSYIGVMDHPYFSVTAANGEFDWTAIPPGEYVVAAWHEGLGELTEKVTLAKGQQAKLSFTFR